MEAVARQPEQEIRPTMQDTRNNLVRGEGSIGQQQIVGPQIADQPAGAPLLGLCLRHERETITHSAPQTDETNQQRLWRFRGSMLIARRRIGFAQILVSRKSNERSIETQEAFTVPEPAPGVRCFLSLDKHVEQAAEEFQRQRGARNAKGFLGNRFMTNGGRHGANTRPKAQDRSGQRAVVQDCNRHKPENHGWNQNRIRVRRIAPDFGKDLIRQKPTERGQSVFSKKSYSRRPRLADGMIRHQESSLKRWLASTTKSSPKEDSCFSPICLVPLGVALGFHIAPLRG